MLCSRPSFLRKRESQAPDRWPLSLRRARMPLEKPADSLVRKKKAKKVPQRILGRIRERVREASYDMTIHAVEEMAEDNLDIVDVETAILNGGLVKTEKHEPRGTKYTLHGIGTDGTTRVGTVGRFTGTGRYLIITVYEVTESAL